MQDPSFMTEKMSIHFVEPEIHTRADLMRIGTSLGFHCEIYSDFSEMALYPPRSGLIIVRDRPDLGVDVGRGLETLIEMGVALPVIAMDIEPSCDRVVQAVKVGALDYLVLPLSPERLAACLERVGREALQVSATRRRMITAQQLLLKLSPREREVLEGLANGGSNKEIARVMQISPRTVEIHRANMMMKLDARHSSEAIRLRIEAGISSMPIVIQEAA